MKILIVQRIFTYYRKEVLDELHKEIDFVLLHSANKSSINQVSSSYSMKVSSFQYSKKETNVFLNVFPYIFKNRPEIIIHEFSIGIASLIPTFMLARFLGIKFILWGHGYDRTKGFYPNKSLNDKLRLYFIKKADAVIFYGNEAKILFSEYINCDKLFTAPNCLNTNILNSFRDNFEKEGKEKIKNKIGFKHKYNLIFIGRILEFKQPQILLDIYEFLYKIYGNIICIHFVGDGNFLNQLEDLVKHKGIENNIKFYGAIHDDIINGELLYCSDLMVMPGLVGLSVNHAFNFDCPVVTFEQDGHGPEIEYLINQKTGYIVEAHTTEAMAFIISQYLKSKDVQYQMKINIRKMLETKCSINSFIKGFVDAIEFVRS
ncbi:glycosyltransferase [Aquipluma nitroreducens]|uniref:Glycosyltransferase n=1 Tax=Aquipluma nitroreducens TaxID=2010828 RepID=A0A5K7SGA0_9BACT|nr:glycosyltransferase [Aquipluma nitroreducens]BBE20573.1 glycosyltransferase [Aquipluma nitroreducens]